MKKNESKKNYTKTLIASVVFLFSLFFITEPAKATIETLEIPSIQGTINNIGANNKGGYCFTTNYYDSENAGEVFFNLDGENGVWSTNKGKIRATAKGCDLSDDGKYAYFRNWYDNAPYGWGDETYSYTNYLSNENYYFTGSYSNNEGTIKSMDGISDIFAVQNAGSLTYATSTNNWTSLGYNTTKSFDFSETRKIIWGDTSGVYWTQYNFSSTTTLAEFEPESFSISWNGLLYCLIRKSDYRIYFGTINEGLGTDYITNAYHYSHCKIDNDGIIYLWGDNNNYHNIVMKDSNNPSANAVELVQSLNSADIVQVELQNTAKKVIFTDGLGLYRTDLAGIGGGTPPDYELVPEENIRISEFRIYPSNQYGASTEALGYPYLSNYSYSGANIYYNASSTPFWDTNNDIAYDKLRVRMSFLGTAETSSTTRIIVDKLDKNLNLIEKDWLWFEYDTQTLIDYGWNSVLNDLEPPTELYDPNSTNSENFYSYAITLYDKDNSKTIQTIILNVLKVDDTFLNLPTDEDIGELGSIESILGTTTRGFVCTEEEWTDGNWWEKLRCSTFKTILDILGKTIDAMRAIFKTFINILKNMFPFNFVVKIFTISPILFFF